MSLYIKKRKKVLKKLLVGSNLFAIGAAVYWAASLAAREFSSLGWMNHPLFPVLMMTLLALAVYKPLDSAYTQLFKYMLFKKRTYGQITLMNLAEELALVLDVQELANLVVNTFGEVLHLKTVALLTPSPIRGDFEIVAAFGWNISDYLRVRLSADSPLVQQVYARGEHILVRDRIIQSLNWQEANRLTHDFDSLRANWIIPLFVKEELKGMIVFSSLRPGFMFDEADFHFFREFARSVARSLRNALSVRELKMANTELQDVQSQLLQATKLNAIEQLATGLAHEIRNPLAIISGKAQVLLLQKNRQALDEEVQEVLQSIVKQTKRAADITRKLLMFSQGAKSPKEVLRLERVLQETLALVSYQTSLEGIEITDSISPNLPSLYASVQEMREIFLNLILNAVQSIGSQGKIHIEMNYLSKDEIIQIQVSDTGRGIDQDHIEKLFNPFFTTRHESTGLGLFVTRQIVHRYGGSIRVESRPGEGSLFTVQFPHWGDPESLPKAEGASLSLFAGSEGSSP